MTEASNDNEIVPLNSLGKQIEAQAAETERHLTEVHQARQLPAPADQARGRRQRREVPRVGPQVL